MIETFNKKSPLNAGYASNTPQPLRSETNNKSDFFDNSVPAIEQNVKDER